MYEAFFSLKKRPFSAVALVEEYIPSAVCEEARVSLARCVERGEGIGMLVGPVGTGKTMICRKLAELFKKSCHVALLACGRLGSRRSLFQAILYELGQAYRGMDEGELRLGLIDFLTAKNEKSRPLLLLIDEAHTLPLRLVDEIRMLTNLAKSSQPLVRLVLSGNCSLEERLASPRLDSLNSQITARCYLEAMGCVETRDYLNARIDMAGGNGPEIFSEEACQSIHRSTDGMPRLVNQLCDHALLVAFAAGRRRLESANIEEAWADLQQLPTPWTGESKEDKPGVIEFGRLDDMPEAEQPSACLRMPSPTLRINSISGTDLDLGDAEERINSIEKMIAGVEGDFEPTGSIEPEIELTFEEFDHPFKEPFADEEVVNDRYATLEPPKAVAPAVLPQKLTEPAAAAKGAEVDVKKTVALHRTNDALRTAELQTFGSKTVSVAEAPSPESDSDAENDSMLIVEEDEPAVEVKILRPVRRNEYRRLFAKLRHG